MQKKRDLTLEDVFTVYRQDWGDNYDADIDPEVKELERQARGLSTKPKTYTEYMESMKIYDKWMDYLIQKYGGEYGADWAEEVFWNKVNSGCVTDYIPQKPRITNRRLNRQVNYGLTSTELFEIDGEKRTELTPEYVKDLSDRYFNEYLEYEGITEEEYFAEKDRVAKLFDPEYDEEYAWSPYAPMLKILNASEHELEQIEADEREKYAILKDQRKFEKKMKKLNKRLKKQEEKRLEEKFSHLSKKKRKKEISKIKKKKEHLLSQIDFLKEAVGMSGGNPDSVKYLNDVKDKKKKNKKAKKKAKAAAKNKFPTLKQLMSPDWKKYAGLNVEDYDYYSEQDNMLDRLDNTSVFLQTDEESKKHYRILEKLGWDIYAMARHMSGMSKKEVRKAKKKEKKAKKRAEEASIKYMLRPEDEERTVDVDYDDAFNKYLAAMGQADPFVRCIEDENGVMHIDCPEEWKAKFS